MLKSMLFISIDPIEYRRRVLNEIETAQDAGYHVIVISTSSAKLIQNKYDFEYIGISIPGFFKKGVFRFPIFNFLLLLKILFLNFDVIHFRGIVPIPAILIRRFLRKSILIYDAHEYYRGHKIFDRKPVQKKIWLFFEKRIIPRLEYLITVSEPLGELFKSDYPNLKNVLIIRSLPSLISGRERIEREKDKSEDKIVLFHGYFLPGRALENIVKAFSLINDKSIKLVLIGTGPLEKKLRNLANETGMTECIEFVDFVPNEQLIEYIQRATIGLSIIQADCLNRKFALPNKFFEYIHAGLPVLASNIPTLKSYVDKYKVGLTVDPEVPEKIAEGITKMTTDEPMLQIWKKNCIQAATDLNWQNEAKILLNMYKNLKS